MTIKDLKDKNLIIYECISGSKAFGLDIPTSDTDIKGVFILPKSQFFGFDYIPQISNPSNDIVYYELGRYIELLLKNNPNLLELLASPEDKILLKHPFLNVLKPSLFVSQLCKDSFGGYAFTQIKKARGLNKKIVNPIDKKKKSILDFCFVLEKQGSIPLKDWLINNNLHQDHCGLINIKNAKSVYAIFQDKTATFKYKGILKNEASTGLLLSSIPKNETPIAYMVYNEDAFIKYCKDYKQYWDWVKNRNQNRYLNNINHGKNYDSKNMMHTFRLLDMALEILEEGIVKVKRPNRAMLLSIRKGDFEYDDLIAKAALKLEKINQALQNSTLQAKPDKQQIEKLLIELRNKFYLEKQFQ